MTPPAYQNILNDFAYQISDPFGFYGDLLAGLREVFFDLYLTIKRKINHEDYIGIFVYIPSKREVKNHLNSPDKLGVIGGGYVAMTTMKLFWLTENVPLEFESCLELIEHETVHQVIRKLEGLAVSKDFDKIQKQDFEYARYCVRYWNPKTEEWFD